MVNDPKATSTMVEDPDSKSVQGTATGRPLPPILEGLSEEELNNVKKKLLRKADIRLLPMLTLIYIMNYLDRNAIGVARIGGLEDDLGLHGSQFQSCVSILSVGYILMQVPSNLLLNYIGRPAAYLSICMMTWGTLCACSGAAQSFNGLLATRFFLGFVEAAFYPGAIATLSAWYVRSELGLRTGLFYSGSLLSGAFSGLIAAGIVNGMNGARGLLAWRWIFIIEGSIAVLVSGAAFFILPNFPANTKWLTEEERAYASWRMEADAAGEEDWTKANAKQSFFNGARLLVKDKKNWILVVLVYGASSAIGINSFFPTVVGSLGKSHTVTLLLTAPPYLLACFVCAAVGWHAGRTSDRYWHIVASLSCALAGFIICAAATGIGPRYFGAMIMIPGIYTSFNLSMVWTANTIYRPVAKRAAAVAFNNALATLSSIYGAYLFPNNSGPRFVLAFSVNGAMTFMAITAATVLHFVLKRENTKIERRERDRDDAGVVRTEPGFRYVT